LHAALDALENKAMNPLKHEVYLERLVATARAIISNQIALPMGAVGLRKYLTMLQWLQDPRFLPVHEYLGEVTAAALPIGKERLLWQKAALKEKDLVLMKISNKYYERTMAVCWEVVEQYESATKASREKRKGI
jgi:hypothetical protein